MSDEASWADGYFLHRALSSLETVGSSKGDGWSTIREFWEALANDDVDREDAARWAQAIAKRVVNQNVFGAEAKERPKRALAALGLVGVQGEYRREREYMEMLEEFTKLLDEDKRHLRATRRKLAKHMLKNGFFLAWMNNRSSGLSSTLSKMRFPKK